jgi:hypothetical protein
VPSSANTFGKLMHLYISVTVMDAGHVGNVPQ